MWKKTTLNWTFILVLILPACAATQTPLPTTQASPQAAVNWSVTMTQSGGIMGLQRTIAVTSDGKVHVEDPRANQSFDGELTQGQLAQLDELVRSAKLAGSKNPGVCMDCFIYDVQVVTTGKPISAHLSDTDLPDSGMEELVIFLRQLMDGLLG